MLDVHDLCKLFECPRRVSCCFVSHMYVYCLNVYSAIVVVCCVVVLCCVVVVLCCNMCCVNVQVEFVL